MLEDFRQAFNDPASWHAMVVHFPVVLGSLAFLPIVVALVLRRHRGALLGVALVMLLMMSFTVFVAIRAGEAADTFLTISDMMPLEEKAISKHEELAENGWAWPLIPAALVIAAMIPWKGKRQTSIQTTAASLAVVGALSVAGWVALTAHAGGQIVYIYGVGPPERGMKLPVSEMGKQKTLSPVDDGADPDS